MKQSSWGQKLPHNTRTGHGHPTWHMAGVRRVREARTSWKEFQDDRRRMKGDGGFGWQTNKWTETVRPELENISVRVVQHILTFDWCFSSLIPKVQTIQKYTPLYLRDNVFHNKYKEMKCAKSLFIFIVKLSAKNLEFIDPLRPTLIIFQSR